MKPVAVRNIECTDGATIDELGTLEVATVHEARGRRGLLKPYIRPSHPGAGRRQRRHHAKRAGHPRPPGRAAPRRPAPRALPIMARWPDAKPGWIAGES